MKAIALGSDGSVYVAGNLHPAGFAVPLPFPLTRSSVPACGQFDAFVARLDSTLSSLLYATCLQGPPGQNVVSIYGLAVDRDGSAIVGIPHSLLRNP